MAGIFQNGLFTMGFDMDPPNSFFSTGSGNSASSSNTPLSFGYAWSCGSNNSLNLGTNLTELIMGMYVYIPTFSSGNEIMLEWYDTTGGATQVSLRYFADGHLQFYSGNGPGTTLGPASSAGVISASTWTYIETNVIFSATVGFVGCHINGTSVITETANLNTIPTTNAWVNNIVLHQASTAGNTLWDDWYMLDTTGTSPLNTYLGPVQVRGEKTSANSAVGGRNAYTPTNPTNVNYTNVGNIPYNTSEYNADQTAGDFDMFKFPNLPSNVITVYAVNEWAVLELDAAGARTVSLDCYSASGTPTDNLGTAFTPATGTPSMYYQSNVVNPSGGGVWTTTTAQAAELGVKTVT